MEPLAAGQVKDGAVVGVGVGALMMVMPDSVMVMGALLATVMVTGALLALMLVLRAPLGSTKR